MGHQPFFIHRISVKSKTHLVKNPAVVHGRQRLFHHEEGLGLRMAGVPSQEQGEMVRGREFGGLAEAAPAVVKTHPELLVGFSQHPRSERASSSGGRLRLQHPGDLITRLPHFIPLVPPHMRQLEDEVHEPRDP